MSNLRTNYKNVWSEDKETMLISFYQDHRFLWEVKHPEYHDRTKKHITLLELVNQLEADIYGKSFTVESVSKKFANLRTTFQREAKKVAASKETNTIYSGKWPRFQQLKFLLEEPTIQSGDSSADTLDDFDTNDNYQIVLKMERGELSENDELSDDSWPPSSYSGGSTAQDPKLPKPPSRKKTKVDGETAARVAGSNFRPPLPTGSVDDEDDLFFKSMALAIKRIPLGTRQRVKLQIHALILENTPNID